VVSGGRVTLGGSETGSMEDAGGSIVPAVGPSVCSEGEAAGVWVAGCDVEGDEAVVGLPVWGDRLATGVSVTGSTEDTGALLLLSDGPSVRVGRRVVGCCVVGVKAGGSVAGGVGTGISEDSATGA